MASAGSYANNLHLAPDRYFDSSLMNESRSGLHLVYRRRRAGWFAGTVRGPVRLDTCLSAPAADAVAHLD